MGSSSSYSGSSSSAKGLAPRVLVGILLALIDLFLELLCFFLVCKGQAGHAFFQLKGVEEGPVLVVLEGVVDLLVPDDTAIGGLGLGRDVVSEGVDWVQDVLIEHTDTSTSLIQNVFPTKSLASTTAPCRPVYVQWFRSG